MTLLEHFGTLDEDGCIEDYCEAVACDFFYDLFKDLVRFEYKTGISKIVLLSVDGDYVYKLPFNGYFEDEFIDDDEDETERIFKPFKGAYGTDSSNYCQAELELLEDEIPSEFYCMFPETTKFTFKYGFEDVDVYKQERCASLKDNGERLIDTWNAPSERVSTANNCSCEFDEDWIGQVELWYGADFAIEFLRTINNVVSDLHRGNYGYSVIDGRPVIIDWAGYDS